MDKKLSLLRRREVAGPLTRPHCRPVDLAQIGDPTTELSIAGSGVGETERPPNDVTIGPFHHRVQVRLQVDDILLPSVVGQVRVVVPMDHIEHHRAWTKEERDIFAHTNAGVTVHEPSLAPTLDLGQADTYRSTTPCRNRGVGEQAARTDDCVQILDVGDVVDLRERRNLRYVRPTN